LTLHAKFYVNLLKGGRGGSRQIDEKYANFFLAVHIYLFSETHLQVRPFGGFFACDGSNDAVSRKDVLLGVKKFEINI